MAQTFDVDTLALSGEAIRGRGARGGQFGNVASVFGVGER